MIASSIVNQCLFSSGLHALTRPLAVLTSALAVSHPIANSALRCASPGGVVLGSRSMQPCRMQHRMVQEEFAEQLQQDPRLAKIEAVRQKVGGSPRAGCVGCLRGVMNDQKMLCMASSRMHGHCHGSPTFFPSSAQQLARCATAIDNTSWKTLPTAVPCTVWFAVPPATGTRGWWC